MHFTGRIAIVGTGAVGGFYGGLLSRCGYDVHFLLHSDFDHVQKNGLLIESPLGDFKLPNVNAYSRADRMPRCDVIFVALKTTANHLLPEMLPHITHADSSVVVLQNGLGVEDEVAGIDDVHRVLGGLCFLCANKVGPGHIRHLDYGLITLGEFRADQQAAGVTPHMEQIGALFQTAGIPHKLVEDLTLARWKKLVWNIPFNGLSVIRNQLTDQLVADPQTRALCLELMREVARASEACAQPIEAAFIEKMMADTEMMTPYAPSMKLDFDAGRSMEIEAIYGAPLRSASAAGVEMPETRKIYGQLKVINVGADQP